MALALELMYITNDADIALLAEKYGVDRIWIDLETIGKEERQKGRDSVKSHHTIADIRKISHLLTKSKMMVRVNPWNENSVREIDEVINAGAEIVMFPMWKTIEEVQQFLHAVDGRARTNLLLETREAEGILDDVLEMGGVDEIHVGLNDLHISYDLVFMFELLSNGTVERICKKIEAAGIKFGFGGIARIGEGVVPAEEIILEHYRMHSSMAILSRSFCNYKEMNGLKEIETVFSENMKKLRDFEKYAESATIAVFEKNKSVLKADIESVVANIRAVKL